MNNVELGINDVFGKLRLSENSLTKAFPLTFTAEPTGATGRHSPPKANRYTIAFRWNEVAESYIVLNVIHRILPQPVEPSIVNARNVLQDKQQKIPAPPTSSSFEFTNNLLSRVFPKAAKLQ